MKKYFVLIVISVVLVVCVLQIPNISNEFAKECYAVAVVNSSASESVFCKGTVVDDYGDFVVKVQINEEDIPKVHCGQTAKISCKALGDELLLGKVKELSDFAYKISYGGINITVVDATIEIEGDFKNLKSGYSVTAEIVYTEIKNAVILPFEGIAQEKDGKYYVYRIENDWAVKQYVDIAFEDEKGAVISGECNFKTVCEEPESFSGDFVRIKYVGDN